MCKSFVFTYLAVHLLSPSFLNNELCLDYCNCIICHQFLLCLTLFLLPPPSWRKEGRGGQKPRSCWLKPRKLVQLMLFTLNSAIVMIGTSVDLLCTLKLRQTIYFFLQRSIWCVFGTLARM